MSVAELLPAPKEGLGGEVVPVVLEPNDPQAVVNKLVNLFLSEEIDLQPLAVDNTGRRLLKIAMAESVPSDAGGLPVWQEERFTALQKNLNPFAGNPHLANKSDKWIGFLTSILEDRLERSEWSAEAACRNAAPEIFHPTPPRGRGTKEKIAKIVEPAMKLCAGCGVKEKCLEFGETIGAQGMRDGEIRIYGGKVFYRRRKVR